jgi:predicted nucleic acid-binding protein
VRRISRLRSCGRRFDGEPVGITFDTNFIIDLLRSDRLAVGKAKEIETRGDIRFLTAPVLYEITAGLLFARSRSEATVFRAFASRLTVLPFDESSSMKAAEIRAELMRLGRPKGHLDTMIAGIVIQGGHTLVTRDRDLADISQAVGLSVERY